MNLEAASAGVLAVALWASIPALVKAGVQRLDVSFLLVLRFVISSSVMLPFLSAILKKARQIKFIFWFALLIVLGANYYFQALAMAAVPVSWYLVIFSLNPVLALIILRVPLSRKMILPLMIAIVGTVFFLDQKTLSTAIELKAFACLVIGMLTWVLYTFLVTKFHRSYNDVETTALTQIVSWVAVFLIWGVSGFPMQRLDRSAIFSVLALGLTTPIAYFSFSYCLRRLPIFGVISQYLEPVIGILIGMIFFRESLTVPQLLGSAAILVGMAKLPVKE